MTPTERKLWGYKTYPYRVLRRPIGRFIADLYCAELKFVTKVDGAGHFTPAGRAKDRTRAARLEGYGLRVRLTNLETFVLKHPPS